jgi:hypothetical protein
MEIHKDNNKLPKLIENDDQNELSIDNCYVKLKMIYISKKEDNKSQN